MLFLFTTVVKGMTVLVAFFLVVYTVIPVNILQSTKKNNLSKPARRVTQDKNQLIDTLISTMLSDARNDTCRNICMD